MTDTEHLDDGACCECGEPSHACVDCPTFGGPGTTPGFPRPTPKGDPMTDEYLTTRTVTLTRVKLPDHAVAALNSLYRAIANLVELDGDKADEHATRAQHAASYLLLDYLPVEYADTIDLAAYNAAEDGNPAPFTRALNDLNGNGWDGVGRNGRRTDVDQ